LVEASKIYTCWTEVYYNQNTYAKFGTETILVKRQQLAGNINSGHFNIYFPVSNNSVPQNSTTVPSLKIKIAMLDVQIL